VTATPIDAPANIAKPLAAQRKDEQLVHVSLVSRHAAETLLRQTDDGAGRHHCDTGVMQLHLGWRPEADWLVVLDSFAQAIPVTVPRERRVLFVTEPPGIKTYSAGFANQFGTLVSPVPVPGYIGNWLHTQSSLPWFYGIEFPAAGGNAFARLNLTDLRAMPCPTGKQARISVICSTKSKLPRHRQRLDLLAHLKQQFPSQIDIFGSGFQQIPDKADAIAPYRYHLVLENTDIDHFWTEKTADAYLGFALPLFSGCANIGEYFAEQSLVRLPEIEDRAAVCATISQVLNTDPYLQRLDAIREARHNLIERYNMMAVVAGLATAEPPSAAAPRLVQPTLLRVTRDFNGLTGWIRGRTLPA
jgi:Glycosyltransferase family 10 (fucosyltransferase) C-term